MVASKSTPLQTEFEFTLPKGYVDPNGTVHRAGRMRLATAMDEIVPQRDARVRNNQAYLTVAILSRVVTGLGDLAEVDTDVVENLFAADLAYLQELYRRVNSDDGEGVTVTCPECSHAFEVEGPEPGGS